MINLRYHIVSITAVFLALGIGLTLGTSFLDRVTVDTLKQQLDDVEARVRETDAQNSDLSGQLDRLQERDRALVDGVDRLVDGRLEDVPVLVLAAEGTDQDELTSALETLSASGAEVAGTWTFTDRWTLDDDNEVTDLAEALTITSDDAERLYLAGTARIAQVLLDASAPPAEREVEGGLDETGTEVPEDAEAADVAAAETDEVDPPSEPELLASLVGAGFIDYQPQPGSGDERVLIPAAGVRYVVLSTSPEPLASERALSTVVAEMADDAVVPVLAAQGESDLELADGTPASEDDRRTTFVGPLRELDGVREHISTLDHIDTAGGLLAMVLALDDLGAQVAGHYGVAPGAVGLVPGSPSP